MELWSLGISTPKSLLRAVFYYNGKTILLRGGEEHNFPFFCSVVINTASAHASSPEPVCAKVLDDVLACLAIASTSDQIKRNHSCSYHFLQRLSPSFMKLYCHLLM